MATDVQEIKITEVQQSQSVRKDSSILITQPGPTNKETLYRAPYAQIFAEIAGKSPVYTELPTPTEELRGSTGVYDDGAGDLLYVCVGNTDGTYEWVPLGELPPVTVQDEGKVMAVEDGIWVASDELIRLKEIVDHISVLPGVTLEDIGKIVRVDEEGTWVLSDALTVLNNKIPWDVEDLSSGADYDEETGTVDIYGDGMYYESGIVHISGTVGSFDDHTIII